MAFEKLIIVDKRKTSNNVYEVVYENGEIKIGKGVVELLKEFDRFEEFMNYKSINSDNFQRSFYEKFYKALSEPCFRKQPITPNLISMHGVDKYFAFYKDEPFVDSNLITLQQ
jgi:hypothetical protein